MEIQWWCAAQGQPWSWEWRAYPGVWAVSLLILGLFVFALKRVAPANQSRAAVVAGYIGVALTWLTLDWPVGALGAGYLVSVHSLKFLMLAFVVPPLLWLPFAGTAPQTLAPRSALVPVAAAVFFNVVLVITHAPPLVNAWAETQLGSFAIDALWLLAGMAFWREVIVQGLIKHPLLKMFYVFLGTLGHTFLGMYLLLNKLPAYKVFELAPRAFGIDARMDQGFAGALMILVGTPLLFITEIVLFAQWFREHNAPPEKSPPASRA